MYVLYKPNSLVYTGCMKSAEIAGRRTKLDFTVLYAKPSLMICTYAPMLAPPSCSGLHWQKICIDKKHTLQSINQKGFRQLAIFAYSEVVPPPPFTPNMRQCDSIGSGNNYADSCFELCFFFFMNRFTLGPTVVSPHKVLYFWIKIYSNPPPPTRKTCIRVCL